LGFAILRVRLDDMTRSHFGPVPELDFDPYHDEALLDSWPGYRLLRDAGPGCLASEYEMFALTRYASVWRALDDWESFPPALAS
jgi:cytochrome P450